MAHAHAEIRVSGWDVMVVDAGSQQRHLRLRRPTRASGPRSPAAQPTATARHPRAARRTGRSCSSRPRPSADPRSPSDGDGTAPGRALTSHRRRSPGSEPLPAAVEVPPEPPQPAREDDEGDAHREERAASPRATRPGTTAGPTGRGCPGSCRRGTPTARCPAPMRPSSTGTASEGDDDRREHVVAAVPGAAVPVAPPVVRGQQVAQRGEQVGVAPRARLDHREARGRVRHPHGQQPSRAPAAVEELLDLPVERDDRLVATGANLDHFGLHGPTLTGMRTAFGCEFDVPDGYLNTASVGVPPAPVADAVAGGGAGWRTGRGPPARFRRAHRDAPAAAFADLVGVPPAWVAIGGAVSALVGLLAASVPDGARVLVAAGEFTSVTWPFAAQSGRGVDAGAGRAGRAGGAGGRLRRRRGQRGAVRRRPPRRPGRAARRAGERHAAWCSTPRRPSAGSPPTCRSPTPSWRAATSGCSARGARRGSRCAPAGRSCRTTRAGTPGTTSGTASTGCRCASPPTRGPSTPRPPGTATRAPPSRCRGWPGWTARRPGSLRRAWPTRSAPAWGCAPAGSAIVAVRRPDALARLAAAGVVASARAGAARLAFHLYNTDDDVARAVAALTR